MSGIIIVGAGEAGVSAAFSLRECGYDGPIDLFGSELHVPYEKPPLSKLPVDGESEPGRSIRPLEAFASHQITLHRGKTISSIQRPSRTVKFVGGGSLAYSRLLLATGSVPRRLPVPGGESCVYLRTLDDARLVRQAISHRLQIAIVGAGFIGLEIAASARQNGCEVSVFEGLPRILSRAVPAEIAAALHNRHVGAGVRISCSQKLTGIATNGRTQELRFADGSTFQADVVLAGIGSQPVTALAQDAGLAVSNGISVDAHLRTTDPDVFAAGDCCCFPTTSGESVRLESWRAAKDQGRTAALNMLGRAQQFTGMPWFWSDQYELTLQVAGLPNSAVRTVRRKGVAGLFLFHLDEANRIVAVSALAEGNILAKDVRLSEMLIAAQTISDPELLQTEGLNLKQLAKMMVA